MHVSKWGNSLAVRLPKDVVERMGLKEGDQIDATLLSDNRLQLRRKLTREEALERMSEAPVKLPPGYSFNREELYER